MAARSLCENATRKAVISASPAGDAFNARRKALGRSGRREIRQLPPDLGQCMRMTISWRRWRRRRWRSSRRTRGRSTGRRCRRSQCLLNALTFFCWLSSAFSWQALTEECPVGQVLWVVLEPRWPRGMPLMPEFSPYLAWHPRGGGAGSRRRFRGARQAATSNLAHVVVCWDVECLSQQLGQ